MEGRPARQRRLSGRAEYRTKALSLHNPIPTSLFVVCAPAQIADGNALPYVGTHR